MKRLLAFNVMLCVLSCSSCGARTPLLFDDTSVNDGTGGTAGTAGLDAGTDGSTNPAVLCSPGTFTLQKASPALMLILDRSRSMEQSFSSTGESRWITLGDALSTALPPVDPSMAMGALIFPVAGAQEQSCSVPGAPDVFPALGTAASIVSLLQSTSPSGATPTAEAITTGGNALLSFRAASTARSIVLATDGGPDCNSSLDSSTCLCVDGSMCNDSTRCLDDKRTIERIETFAKLGVPTYVIGIQNADNDTNNEVLDAMAVAGTRAQSSGGHQYFSATSENELNQALVAIRDQVGACTYLTASVPGQEGTITVTLHGQTLPYDETGAAGWSWVDKNNGEIVFASELCSEISVATELPVADVVCEQPEIQLEQAGKPISHFEARQRAGAKQSASDAQVSPSALRATHCCVCETQVASPEQSATSPVLTLYEHEPPISETR